MVFKSMKIKNFSILIPVFNYDVNILVNQLQAQALSLKIDYEILLIDDKSDAKYIQKNKKLENSKNVRFIFLKENIGRSRIRNLLFEKAKYESCIIMDCDVELVKPDFLLNYLQKLDNNVVVGGHKYADKAPKDKNKYFHWLYGSNVEVQKIKSRLKNPYTSFMTNSFATTKTIFNKIKLNASITDYGHEDTLFGIALKKHKIKILHIYNPVLHLGLDNEKEFYSKQELAIKNLVRLYKNDEFTKDLSSLKLIKFYNSPLKHTLGFIKLFSKFNPKDKSKLINFSLWKFEKFNFYMKK